MTFKRIGANSRALKGVDHTRAGHSAGETTSLATQQRTSEIGAWLGKQHPADMDKLAESRALSHVDGLQIKYTNRFPAGGGSYEVAVGCSVKGTDAQRAAAVTDLMGFQTPAETDHIEDWLAELSVITAGRGPDGISAELLVNAYASRLKAFPADVVRWALLTRTWKWFPTWEELEKICSAKSSARIQMIAELKRPAPLPEPVMREATPEERARVQALVDEMFPSKTAEDRKAAVDMALKGACMSDQPEHEDDAAARSQREKAAFVERVMSGYRETENEL